MNQGGEATTESKPRAPRQPKQRGPPEDGIPSKLKVMVANLPYDLSEDKVVTEISITCSSANGQTSLQLKDLFEPYEPTAAKIALRPIPRFMVRKLQARNEPRKGRGFGFVSCGSEELQQKAVDEMNGKEVDGREIAVKVAIDSPGKEDDNPGKEDGDHEAAAGTEHELATENGVVEANDAPATVEA